MLQMDIVTPQGFTGDVASYMQQNQRLDTARLRPWFNPRDGRCYVTVYTGGPRDKRESYRNVQVNRDELQTYGTLRRDEWKALDQAVQEICRIRLGGIQDLYDKGLVYSLGNAMGTTVLEYHSISDPMEAAVTMDGVTRAPGDRPKYYTHYLPIPIIHSDFEINTRALEASRNLGNALDVDSVQAATWKVNDKLEELLFTNTSYAFGAAGDDGYNSIYSYLSHPQRNTGSLTGAWTGLTGAQIITDVVNMKQAAISAKHYGPFMLYIPTAYETVLDKDYDATTPGTTIRERIEKIANIDAVKVVDKLTAANVLLVEMLPRTVRMVEGMGIQVVEWMTEGKFVSKFKVLRIAVPQVRADQDGNSGVVHYSV